MKGIDISHWNANFNLERYKDDYDFCIIKATEGEKILDSKFVDYSVQLTKLNKLTGCYHYAKPPIKGLTKIAIERQAQFFLSTVDKANLLGNAILALDYEEFVGKEDDRYFIENWCNYIKSQTGVTPFVYSFYSGLKQIDYDFDYPVWMALWSDKLNPFNGDRPHIDEIKWKIWQYKVSKDGSEFEGNKVPIDIDFSLLTKEQWSEYAKSDILSDWYWAIRKGFFQPNQDRKASISREDLARILKKLL